MRPSLTLLCTLLLSLTGCGSAPVSRVEHEEAAPPVAVVTRQQLEESGAKTIAEYVSNSTFITHPVSDETVLVINAPAGAFHRYETRTIDTPLDLTVELMIERFNAHPKFGSRGGVCVTSSASDHRACVYVERRYATGPELRVNTNLYKDDTLVSSLPTPGNFEVGSAVRIGLRSRTDGIEFKVGDGAWQMQALPFSPKPIAVLCVSAVCNVRVRPAAGTAH